MKRVRFAESRVDDNAEMPERTSVSSSVPKSSTEPALSSSAIEVPDQVMSEGASSSHSTGVKRSNDDSFNTESVTKRFHTDHSTRDVVMLLDDSDVSQTVEQCREVCRRKGTFVVDVNDWDCESRDNFRACGSDGTTVACSSGGITRELMSNESRLLDFLAAAHNSNGRLGIARNSIQFWSIEPRWKRKTPLTRWEMLFLNPVL